MNKLYSRIDWENYPSSATPINEDNLNKMDAAIDEIDTRVVTMDTTKLSVVTANTMVKDVAFDETTGVFTITKLNGSVLTINTALEKIATNFVFDESTQKLILTLIDGSTQEVDLTALLTQYEFLDSDTIAFTISSDGKVIASVKNGSITGDKLEPNYLADVTLQANNAKDSADNAKESELLAYQYAEDARQSASETQKNDASNISYNNTTSGLASDNVQDAIDEIKEDLENFTITVDDALSSTSTNPVQNKVVTNTLNEKAKKDGSNASGTWGINISGNATTATKATQDGSGNNIVNTYAKKSSVLSTVAECEASTTSTDIAGASALAELNDSLIKSYRSVGSSLVAKGGTYKLPSNAINLGYEGEFPKGIITIIFRRYGYIASFTTSIHLIIDGLAAETLIAYFTHSDYVEFSISADGTITIKDLQCSFSNEVYIDSYSIG